MTAVLDFFTNSSFTIATVFWTCILLGAVLAVISVVFGEIMDFAFDADFGPLSGPVIASFLVLFGGAGLVLYKVMGVGPVASSLGAGLVSIAGSSVVYYVFVKVILSQQGGTSFDPKNTEGVEADVIIQIPAKGSGEITFDHTSGRISGPARSATGQAIENGTLVVIERFIGGTYVVRPMADVKEVEPSAKPQEVEEAETLNEKSE